MSGFSINITNPIPLILLIPKSINNVRGVVKKEYPSIEEALNVKDKKEIQLIYSLVVLKRMVVQNEM